MKMLLLFCQMDGLALVFLKRNFSKTDGYLIYHDLSA